MKIRYNLSCIDYSIVSSCYVDMIMNLSARFTKTLIILTTFVLLAVFYFYEARKSSLQMSRDINIASSHDFYNVDNKGMI